MKTPGTGADLAGPLEQILDAGARLRRAAEAAGRLDFVPDLLTIQVAARELQSLTEALPAAAQPAPGGGGGAALPESPAGPALPGERRAVTVLMSDLRGFASLAERLRPEQVVLTLNRYLGAVVSIVERYHGTVDDLIGDAVLAIFGAPEASEDAPQRAIACAAAMQLAMSGVNAWLHEQGLAEVEMGVAVHTGEAVVGRIGPPSREKFGVVGNTVRLTSRFATYTVGGQVLISEAAYQAAGREVLVGGQMSVRAKGASEPLVAYELRGIGGPWNVHLPQPEHSSIRLDTPVSIRFAVIAGKQIAENTSPGLMLGLSAKGAEIASDQVMAPLTDLRLTVLAKDGTPVPGDLYAKVVEHERPTRTTFPVRFTSMPPEVETFIRTKLGKG